MKTHCPSCKKSSLNFLHKSSNALYCSVCGKKIDASETIKSALARRGAFLPDDFFQKTDEAPPAPPAVTESSREAALRRIQKMQNHLTASNDGDMSRKINIPKVSKQEAAARKKAILASLANTDEMISTAAPSMPPDITADFAEYGIDVGKMDELLKSEK